MTAPGDAPYTLQGGGPVVTDARVAAVSAF